MLVEGEVLCCVLLCCVGGKLVPIQADSALGVGEQNPLNPILIILHFRVLFEVRPSTALQSSQWRQTNKTVVVSK